MKLIITGANGFIAKNLITELRNRGYNDLFEYTRKTSLADLDEYCKKADFVFHLAAVNRPKDQSEFMDGNYGFTSQLIELLKKHNNNCPILVSSSTQAALDNPYGISKKAGEDIIFKYGKETGAKVLVYRFPNVFGKWCRPNYNSAIATFCHNISRDLPIKVNASSVVMNLVYIDDVVEELINALNGNENNKGHLCEVPVVHTATLGEIVEKIKSFKISREERTIPNMSDQLTKKLYSTYLSYLPEKQFSYDLKMNEDHRGSFTEFIKTPDRGQVSINISKPGITKGNHWHHTKNEKFLVVSGEGVIRFRRIDSEDVIEYYVSGQQLQVLDIPTGFTHNIENIGNTDMVTVMWANEHFDPNRPDTYFLEV
ncbi:capsular polysaccharide biosynthesis protein CapF [Fictibacillus aquaticus]|uniref:Capsular biosynthesis protein n=1 Tax=Fictibacillus aquaticus TaxID=2021314 RepID=A0A235F8H3_9BACL|nr:capsular polysaccharide biosynthesis protein CapF [Fictibacillus aquaticus]OYD57606.1 capsular biosynthesis protein [Fictibacillus aquaticus]